MRSITVHPAHESVCVGPVCTVFDIATVHADRRRSKKPKFVREGRSVNGDFDDGGIERFGLQGLQDALARRFGIGIVLKGLLES